MSQDKSKYREDVEKVKNISLKLLLLADKEHYDMVRDYVGSVYRIIDLVEQSQGKVLSIEEIKKIYEKYRQIEWMRALDDTDDDVSIEHRALCFAKAIHKAQKGEI